ncbi:unnamed protein product [Arctia plantaginis]|uniref:MADF domain-containing protein n=1 Tax=Arctia plantaginis TaxID=874455 RepID=A0A8S1B7M1_ARCPL|nr:unnamed protein product [Arctia plantaginis]
MNNIIDLVRNEPCLYDWDHPDYCNRALKESLWEKIAKQSKYKDGPAAKDAWLKLRNCHRDAIRRISKVSRSYPGFIPKRWKYEKQMEFLLPHMTSRSTNAYTSENSNQMTSNQSEDATNHPDSEFEAEFEQSETGTLETEESYQNSKTSPSIALEVTSPPLLLPCGSQLHIPQPQSPQELAITKHDSRTSVAKRVNSHEMRSNKKSYNNDQDDEMRHFFNTMYVMTKNMPALSRHKLKRGIFNLVSDEEEYLLHSGLISSDTHSVYGNNESATITDPIALPPHSSTSASPIECKSES